MEKIIELIVKMKDFVADLTPEAREVFMNLLDAFLAQDWKAAFHYAAKLTVELSKPAILMNANADGMVSVETCVAHCDKVCEEIKDKKMLMQGDSEWFSFALQITELVLTFLANRKK